jgi:hypothetical protein
METIEKPWWQSIVDSGANMADRLAETAQAAVIAKIDAKFNQQKLTNKDASINQDVQAANAPVKGVNSNGSTIVATNAPASAPVQFAGMSISRDMLRNIAGGAGAAILALLAYKAISK